MKSLARSFVWWPKMDQDIEERVRDCESCQYNRHHPPKAPLHPWEWPKRPWVRLHADYAGPVNGKMLLVLVDAYSKWLEVKAVSSATSAVTIEQHRSIFATHGLPEILVTDNGSNFTSTEFQEFTQRNGIKHVKTSPYHPSSNGLAERSVQTLKEALKKCASDDIERNISRFLFQNRITPHSTTGIAPAELLLGRIPRSHLDLLKPSLEARVHGKQTEQKNHHDQHAKERKFSVEDLVFVCEFPSKKKWLSGKVTMVKGPVTYLVELTDGRIVRRHVDHIRIRTSTTSKADVTEEAFDTLPFSSPVPQPSGNSTRSLPQPLRRSTRISHPPDRLTY